METAATRHVHRATASDRLVGIGCGMGAGALWGLVFLAPELARDFPPLWLAAGRYLAYGLIAAALIGPKLGTLRARIGRREWLGLAWLALTGNTLYYVLLSAAVQTGGVAMTSLVIGFLPVVVTLIGSRDRDAAPLRKLLPSILFCIGGAVCIGWQAIAAPGAGSARGGEIGLLCAIGALASWTTYAVCNSRWLARLPGVSAHDWNLLTGVATGAQSLVLIPVALAVNGANHPGAAWARFAGVSIGVAVLASMGGNALWNRMSRLLPLTLVGQMILFETMFALVYGFLWERRPPLPLELAAFVLVTLSVVTCVAAHRRTPGEELALAPPG
jgi:drug/metabolite transporter (DMT)-like permease